MYKSLVSVALLLSTFACAENVGNTPANQAAPASQNQALNTTQTIRNTLGMTFVRIEAGSFMMGSSEAAADRREKPAHRQTIARPFYIGQFEVTQADWQNVLGENPYTRDRSNPFYNLPGMAARITKPNHPATVSFNDAQEFINALNAQDKAYRYRLPTEAEWEYVARAGTQTRYFFGDHIRDLQDYAWYGEDFASGGSHPVGQKKAQSVGRVRYLR